MKLTRSWSGMCAALFAMALSFGLVSTASAHAHFVSSTPAPGTSSTTPPSSLTITFDDNLDKNLTKITVLGPDGSTVSGATAVSASNPMIASVPLTAAGNGAYTVNWHSVADDDKGVVEGTFKFGVGIPASSLPQTGGGMPGSWPIAGVLALVGVGLLASSLVVRKRRA